MERKTVVTKDIFTGNLPCKEINVDLQTISSLIINNYINTGPIENNLYRDIKLEGSTDLDRINKYFSDQFRLKKLPSPVPINMLGSINVYLECNHKRNHYFPYHYHTSPHMTAVIVIKGEGNIIIQHPSYKAEHAYSEFIMKEGDYYLFNSDLDYFTDKNLSKEKNRQLLFINYELI